MTKKWLWLTVTGVAAGLAVGFVLGMAVEQRGAMFESSAKVAPLLTLIAMVLVWFFDLRKRFDPLRQELYRERLDIAVRTAQYLMRIRGALLSKDPTAYYDAYDEFGQYFFPRAFLLQETSRWRNVIMDLFPILTHLAKLSVDKPELFEAATDDSGDRWGNMIHNIADKIIAPELGIEPLSQDMQEFLLTARQRHERGTARHARPSADG